MSPDRPPLPVHVQSSRRKKPLLLSINRRLRHLRGITVRNISLDAAPRRARGKTIDDEALPFTLNSPTKLQAIFEHHHPGHSRSHSDLSALKDQFNQPFSTDVVSQRLNGAPKRPSMSKTRKSSFGWGALGSTQRQESLEDAVQKHVVDVFFTVHAVREEEPLYISECQRAMNPNFQLFDLHTCSSYITRQSRFVVKLWTSPTSRRQWQCLVELSVDLRALQFIGTSLEDSLIPLPSNSIIFHLTDGLYIDTPLAPTHLSPSPPLPKLHAPPPQSSTFRSEQTSSLSALTRLSTLHACIIDALIARARLGSQITALVTSAHRSAAPAMAAAADTLAKTRRAITAAHKQQRGTTARLAALRASLAARRAATQADASARAHLAAAVAPATRAAMAVTRAAHADTLAALAGQRRRVCEDLRAIFPIEPLRATAGGADAALQQPLAFSIRGLALPNADVAASPPDATAAALGHCAQLAVQLSRYLGTPLPYPLAPRSSSSTARDPVGALAGPRTFALHTRGAPAARFEYAVFLLNKDVERLAAGMGLRLLDIRNTLPGLAYVLFVATAGEGEAPARRAGGVRGLLKGTGGLSGDGGGGESDAIAG